jgi:hypothetical protein
MRLILRTSLVLAGWIAITGPSLLVSQSATDQREIARILAPHVASRFLLLQSSTTVPCLRDTIFQADSQFAAFGQTLHRHPSTDSIFSQFAPRSSSHDPATDSVTTWLLRALADTIANSHRTVDTTSIRVVSVFSLRFEGTKAVLGLIFDGSEDTRRGEAFWTAYGYRFGYRGHQWRLEQETAIYDADGIRSPDSPVPVHRTAECMH